MPADPDQPALRSDIARLDQKIDGVEKRLGAKIDKVAIEVVKINARMETVALRSDLHRLETVVTEKLESFAARMEALWRESAVLPQSHAARITSLEDSRRD